VQQYQGFNRQHILQVAEENEGNTELMKCEENVWQGTVSCQIQICLCSDIDLKDSMQITFSHKENKAIKQNFNYRKSECHLIDFTYAIFIANLYHVVCRKRFSLRSLRKRSLL